MCKKLQKKYEKARQKCVDLRDQLDEKVKEAKLPVLKELHEGKYYKIRNSYGIGSSYDDWWIYLYCREVITLNRAMCTWFQDCPDGRIEIQVDKGHYINGLENEITKKEYDLAFKHIKQKLKAV
jgi:hypothetical protein